jgi:hypothetical protein
LLAEIEAVQDGFGLKKAVFGFNIQENILKQEFL